LSGNSPLTRLRRKLSQRESLWCEPRPLGRPPPSPPEKALETHSPLGNEIITITHLLYETQRQIISVGVSRGALSSCAAKLHPRRISFEALCPCVRPCARATLNQRVGASKGRDSSLPSWPFFGSFLSVQK
jgi:hypothetical protein